MAINPDLVDLDAANAELPPFPEVTNQAPVHTAFFFSAPGSVHRAIAVGDVGRRPRGLGRVRPALPRRRDRRDGPRARRHRADVRGDAAALTAQAALRGRLAANHVPARMTRPTARSRRARRGRPAGRPRSGRGPRCRAGRAGCGWRPPRRRAAGRPAATRLRTALSRAMTDPASVVVPARVTRWPTTSTARPPIRPRPSPVPASATASLTSSSRSGGFRRVMSGHSAGIDVDAVGDELHVDRVVEQGRDGDARRAVVDPGHGVEQVGRRAGAGRISSPGHLGGRRRVTDRHGDLAAGEPGDELARAGQLGRDRDQPQAADERLERRPLHVRRDPQVGLVVRAAPGGRQERALEVEPERLGAVRRRVRHPIADALGERRSSSSGAVTAVGRNEVTPRRSSAPSHAVERSRIAHRVVAAPAVDVDVDEPGGEVRRRPSPAPRRGRRRRSARPRWRSGRLRPDRRGRVAR